MVSLFTGTVSTLAAWNMFFIAFPQFWVWAVFRNQVSQIHSESWDQLCRAISWWGASSSVSLKQAFLQNVKKYEECQRGGWRDGLICPLTHLPPGQWHDVGCAVALSPSYRMYCSYSTVRLSVALPLHFDEPIAKTSRSDVGCVIST